MPINGLIQILKLSGVLCQRLSCLQEDNSLYELPRIDLFSFKLLRTGYPCPYLTVPLGLFRRPHDNPSAAAFFAAKRLATIL